jgi:hypothetical protein
LYKLSAQSISDDEANKIQAAKMYKVGDFSYNLEHPMLMKTLITFTLIAAEKWNATFAKQNKSLYISYEFITRFPNAFFGSLTTIVIYLLANLLFNKRIAIISAALWATGINAIAINRIAKEDTLLVFFMLLGFYFYTKAKWLGATESPYRVKLYIYSGISFGLMMASKYFPHYFGLNFLYHYTRPHEPNRNYRIEKETLSKLFIAMFIAFVIVNPSLFLPSNIHYILSYISGENVIHHGYEIMNRLYYNNFWKIENPTPPYFYLLFIFVKTPTILLILFLLGLFIIFKSKYHDGYYFIKFMFLFWIIPFSFIPSKWLRYTLQFMPFFYMSSAIAIDKFYEIVKSKYSPIYHKLNILLIVILISFLGWLAFSNAPYYLQFVNIIGGGEKNKAYFFPHDEIYDTGIREATAFISQIAPKNSMIACDAPNAVNFYLQLFKRSDITIIELSKPTTLKILQNNNENTIFVIDQIGRHYFSNHHCLLYIYDNYLLIKKININGINTTKIYKSPQTL